MLKIIIIATMHVNPCHNDYIHVLSFSMQDYNVQQKYL